MSPQATSWSQLLARYPSPVQRIARAARRRILAECPDVVEMVDEQANVVGYGFGAGYTSLICTIILNKKGVKLGIVGGATLPDPTHILEGSGKVHRYVDLRDESAVDARAIAALLRTAVEVLRAKIRSAR
jgi:hypothetical protein